ncbi:MAG: FHA domain-containing protein [Phycisphaerales bacterium]|nr:MAG: FHA domain-containing protein [Phycisphaerales bacterium]
MRWGIAQLPSEIAPMIELHVCSKKTGSLLKAFALGDSEEVLIGRDDACDIKIKSRSVSREHCAIEREGESLVLRDLGSTGGTIRNGEKIDRIRLEDGLEVTIGPAVLKFYENQI